MSSWNGAAVDPPGRPEATLVIRALAQGIRPKVVEAALSEVRAIFEGYHWFWGFRSWGVVDDLNVFG